LSIKIKIILFVLIFIWVAGIFVEFIIPYFNGLSYAYTFINRLYATVCHQQFHKLIEFNGHHSLVCSRCSGIYIGGFLSSFILLFIPTLKIRNGKFILLAALPMLTDVLLYSFGFYSYSKIIALITGVLFGSVGIVYIYYGLQILLEKNAK
jgi:uncharacterized membrane protein